MPKLNFRQRAIVAMGNADAESIIETILPLSPAIAKFPLEAKEEQQEAIRWLSSLAKYVPAKKDAICLELTKLTCQLYKDADFDEKHKSANFAAKKLVSRIASYAPFGIPEHIANQIITAIEEQENYYKKSETGGRYYNPDEPVMKDYAAENLRGAFRGRASFAQRDRLPEFVSGSEYSPDSEPE